MPTAAQVSFEGLDLNECQVLWAHFEHPPGMRTWDLPPGWGEPTFSRYEYFYFECERIAWGPNEPSSVRMIVGGPFLSGAPRDCIPNNFQQGVLVVEFYLDDAGVADLLAHDLGIPANGATVSLDRNTVLNLSTDSLRWAPVGAESSAISYRYWNEPDREYQSLWRFLWYNNTSLSALDFQVDEWELTLNEVLVHGKFESPSPLAKQPITERLGGGSFVPQFSAHGEVTTWPNHECKPA